MRLKKITLKKAFLSPSMIICLLIGLCFLWTSAGYLSWMYHMMNFYPDSMIDLLTEVAGYGFQILGLAVYSFLMKKKSCLLMNRNSFTAAMIADLFCIILAVLNTNPTAVLFWGYLMNLSHGLVAGFYLTALVTRIPQQRRGCVFGIGYGIGSIGSWLLSRLGSDNFLKNPYVLLIYALLILLTIGLVWTSTAFPENSAEKSPSQALSKDLLLLAAVTVFLLSAVKNMGFYFPTADLTGDGVSLEFTRIFYAAGLVCAGLLNDKNRKYGAVLCFATLFFPFSMLLLRSNAATSTVLWIIAYLFFGFFSVYRILLFSDLAGKHPDYLFLAGFGLLWGRAGDALGGYIGMCLKEQAILLILLVSLLFFLTVLVFFTLYHRTYDTPLPSPAKSQELLIQEFAERFQLSVRETDVFKQILKGCSNGEIAGNLYISENTVKFHIKNLLRKTDCANRTELLALFSHSNVL